MSNKKSKGRAALEETSQTQRGQNRGQRKPKVQPGEKKQTDEKIVQSDPRNGRRATNRFITERKRAGDALQQSEERFRILFDEALDGICLADAETGFIIDCNQALAALVGRERAELIGQPQKTLHPSQNDKAAYSPTFRQHLNDKEGQTLETQVVTSTGIIRDVEIKANRLNLQGREMLQGIFHDITERKRIEEKLEEERILLRTLIDNLPDRVYVKDVQGRKIISNIADWQASGGKTMEDVIGKTDFDTYPPELAENYWAFDKTVIDSGISIINREEPGLDSQGNPVWVLSSKVPLLDGQGKVVGLVGIGRDITKRKRAEEALRESEEKYRTILENIEEGYFEVDIAGNFTFFNESVCRLLGYSREEMMGMNNRYYTDKTNAPKLYRTFNEVYRTGVPAQGSDWELIRKDNTKRYVECSVSSIKNKSGQPIGFRGIIRDITERKQAEEALRESENRLHTIVEGTQALLVSVDANGHFTYANDATARALGYASPEELTGKSYLHFIHPEDRQQVLDTFINQANTRQLSSMQEFRIVDTAGKVKWFSFLSDLEIKDGQVVGQSGVAQDITERKRAESERQALLEIMQAVAATESLQVLLELIRQSLAKVIYAKNFFVIFHNRSTGLFEEVFAVDKYDPPMPPSKLKKSITSYVFRTGEPLLLTQARFDELVARGEVELVGTNSASWLGAPLKTPSETIGVIAVQNYEDPNCYSERDREFIASVGTQVAQAIDRKRVEQALQESEASLREAQALGQVGNWEYDVESQKITWSDQVYRLYERDPVLEPPTAEEEAAYYSPEQAQILHEYARRAVEEGQDFDYDLEATLPSERRVYFSAKMRPVKDASGRIVKLFGTVQDITERKQAEEQIQRQVETLGALYDISRTLSESDDFNAILDLVTRRAVESAHVTFARVLLLEQDDLVVRAAFPVRVLDHDLQVGQREPLAAHPICQRVLEGNAPLVLQSDSPEAGECAPFFLGIAQTLCIVPLHVREQPFGLLMLGEARAAAREPFTVEKLNLARSIGDQAASTLHRALLHKETVRQLDQLGALHHIDQAIAASMDLRMTLSILLEQVTSQLKVDAGSVLLLNPHLQTLDYAAGRGFRTEALQRTNLRLGEGYAGRAALERKLIYIPDLRGRKTDFLRSPYFSAEGFVAYYGVPLIAKGQVKGVLEVFHRSPMEDDPAWLNFLETLGGQAAIAIDNTQLFDSLQRSTADLVVAYDATIEGWSAALDLRDKETEGHSLRVTEMTMQLARSLGIGEAELVHVRRGALLHDIGKMGVPDSILLKPDKLTDEEWVLMRQHPQLAFDMLAPITYLKPALDVPYCHHEKWDGTGYPRGLKGEEIPLSARIFAVVDVYDALISDRPYRRAWTREKTISHIGEQAGCHFDPEVVKVFLKELANEK
ncbi:MAG: PAS domain S-box protein [Anaerolineales bacterium]|nr:PAS domain S-box protein [Anaerolineales bacterium]